MLTSYEQRLIVHYLANLASCLHHRGQEAKELVEWIASNGRRTVFGSNRKAPRASGGKRRRSRALPSSLGRKRLDLDDLLASEGFKSLEDRADGLTGKQWSRLGEALRSKCSTVKSVRSDRTARRLRCLGRMTGLSRTDVAILELMLRYQTQPIIESMIDCVFESVSFRSTPFNLKSPALSALLGVSAHTILGRLRADAPLVRSGLVCVDSDDGDLTLVNRLHRLATLPGGPGIDVHRLLLGETSPSELEWSDFDHLKHDRDHIERLLEGALDTGEPGVNVLLYGPPGTGKTEFCKVLAARLGVDIHSVGEVDEDGDEPTRDERLQELRFGQRLIARGRRSLLLFDEMEDLLSGSFAGMGIFGALLSSGPRGFRAGGSKVFMNRLLEEAPTPTLWTINDPQTVDLAVLRRMMFALELRLPPPKVRARVWTRQLARHGIEAGPDDAFSLAQEFEATPGVAAGATAAARLGGGDLATVRRGVRSLSRVLGSEKPPQGMPARYDPALLRADTDPVKLADRLVSRGERRFSLCLQGPPGTGKSAFVRYLAERLGVEVVQKRASDLVSMWVGQTEQRIAAAFAEARDSGAFLVFDEADSLLSDRRFAQRNWEVSQVNEMLTWMESHPAPFACTTNYGTHLDPATLRRFVFKITLDYLAPEQAEAAFQGCFGLEPPVEVAGLGTLTPGDFAVVRRKAEVLDCLGDPEVLAAMLRAECDAKPDCPRTIGFQR